MPADWLALSGWGLLLAILVVVAVLIGRWTARLFLRATRADRR